MDIRDLIVGDLVQVNGEVFKVISISYFDIGISDSKEDFYQEHIDNIEPIPLTQKILEKNGFVYFTTNYWKMQVDNDYIELRPIEGNMAIWLDYDEDNDGIYADYILPCPSNLHELQHALRLCGIDKEIEI